MRTMCKLATLAADFNTMCNISGKVCSTFNNIADCPIMGKLKDKEAPSSDEIDFIAYNSSNNTIQILQISQKDREPNQIHKRGDFFIMRADAGETLANFIEKLSAHIKLEHEFYNNLMDCIGEVNWSSSR